MDLLKLFSAENLKDPNTIFGGIALVAATAAVSPVDRWTQGVAVVVLLIAAGGFVLTTASRRQAVLAQDLASQPPTKPIVPAAIVDPETGVKRKSDSTESV